MGAAALAGEVRWTAAGEARSTASAATASPPTANAAAARRVAAELVTTHVSSREAEHFCELRTRKVPALHSQRPPGSADLSVAHALHSIGKSSASRARPVAVFSAQTQSEFHNVKWSGHGKQAWEFEVNRLAVPIGHRRHTLIAR